MKTKKLIIFSGLAVALFTFFIVFSQLIAQNDEQFTQADFVEALTRALGLEDHLKPAANIRDKAELLESLGFAPLGGWELDKIMCKGDVAAVLGQILGIEVPDDATADDYIESLAILGIMTSGKPSLPFSLDDLAAAINVAAGMPDVEESFLQPYHAAMSPTK